LPRPAMRVSLVLPAYDWQLVHTLPKGTLLSEKGPGSARGRLLKTVSMVDVQFGCYSWQMRDKVLYCGYFTRDYMHQGRRAYRSNLQGRVHQYLHNHSRSTKGEPRTNLRVYEQILFTLQIDSVALHLLYFDALQVAGREVPFAQFSGDASLVRTVEALLVHTYKQVRECAWNKI
jgi:hypothetical protein